MTAAFDNKTATDAEREEFLRQRGAKVTKDAASRWMVEYGIILGGLSAAGRDLTEAVDRTTALREACELFLKVEPLPSNLL